MAGTKRERQRTRARAARSVEESARRRRRALQLVGALVAVLVLVGGGALALALVGGDDDPSAAPTASGLPSDWPSDLPTELASFYTQDVPVSCAEPSGVAPRQQSFAPDEYEDAEFKFPGTYAAVLTTSCGDMKIELDRKAAEESVRAMLFLTDRASYYDHTTCHRLTTDGVYLLQCGDTAGDGTGSPGFTVPAENRPKADADGLALYPRGTVAMAAGGERTPAGQFVVFHRDTRMAPDLTVVGEVTEGMDVVDHVVEGGAELDGEDATDGRPRRNLEILTMAGSVDLPVSTPAAGR